MATVITSIRGLQNLGNLENFEADWNSLQTVNLSGLTNLLSVDITDNLTLDGSSKSLTSANFSGCTSLEDILIGRNDFSAGIPNLSGLTNLIRFDSDNCDIQGNVDLSMIPNPGFDNIDLSENLGITSVTLPESDLTNLNLFDTALTEAAVNDILQWLDGSGVTGGSVELDGGTSAAPTGAGITAKDNLIAKSWSVTTN